MSDNNNRRRPTTRSETNPDLLSAPLNPGLRARTPTRDERLASPHNVEDEEGPAFTFQTTSMAEEATRALADALQGMRASSRKPEIPAFDSKNVELWLKRVSNAYRRAGITDSKDKFAFIEPKFSVNEDPRVNELLFGDGTPEDWNELETYLRGRYGRTKSQRAAIILDGTPRDGKLPSEMFSRIKEQIGQITVDDVIKEMVLRELPTDVRRTLHDKIKDLDGADTVKLADEYFDKDGKPIHTVADQPISAVDEAPGLIDTDDESEPSTVNNLNKAPAARVRGFRPQQARNPRQPFNKPAPQRPQPSGKQFPAKNAEQPNGRQFPTETTGWQTVRKRPSIRTVTLCKYHTQYGQKARSCESGCEKYTGKQAGNGKAGRQT